MSYPKQMGVHHMVTSTDPSKWEPQRVNNFEIQLIGIEGSDDVLLSLSTFSPPSINVNPIAVPYQNNELKVAGKPTVSEATVVVNDYIGVNIQNTLQKWFRKVYNQSTQEIGLAAEYKITATVTEYAPNGTLPRTYELKGVWPSSFSLGEYSQEGNNIRQVTMTLQCDECIPDMV